MSAGVAGEEARALHKADFAIDGRSIMIGPMAPQYVKRLEALASLLKRDDLGNLNSATRAKVSLHPACHCHQCHMCLERWAHGLFMSWNVDLEFQEGKKEEVCCSCTVSVTTHGSGGKLCDNVQIGCCLKKVFSAIQSSAT